MRPASQPGPTPGLIEFLDIERVCRTIETARRHVAGAILCAVPGESSCPQCGVELVRHAGFVTWCPACDWNVVPGPRPARVSRLQALEHRLADGMSERLVSDVSQLAAGRTRPPPWLGVTAGLLVLPIHLVTLGSAVGGLLLVLLGGSWPLRVLGLFLLLVAVATRPHLSRRPKQAVVLHPASAPTLFDLIGSVATVTGAPVPDEVLVVTDFNAAAMRLRLRGRALVIGSPLWVACPPSARVALLGHELGHFSHGDLTRGLWIGTGFDTLRRWYAVLRSVRGADALHRVVDVVAFGPMRAAVSAYAEVISRVNAPAHRRQEYLADLDAARVAGTQGALSLMDTLLAGNSVSTAMTRAAVATDRPDMWQTVRDQMTDTPLTEIERRRRAAALVSSRIDDSHPRTTLRIRLLETRTLEGPAVWRDSSAWARIDQEMAAGLATAARIVGERIRYVR